MDDVMRTIESRHSIRRYTSEPVSDETLNKLLSAAACAPSGKNTRPWAFAIIREREKILQLGALMRFSRFLETAPCVIAVYKALTRCYAQSKDDMAIGAAIQNMLLCAEEEGLGACWIGENIEAADKLLASTFETQDHGLTALIALGHRTYDPEDTEVRSARPPAILLKRRCAE